MRLFALSAGDCRHQRQARSNCNGSENPDRGEELRALPYAAFAEKRTGRGRSFWAECLDEALLFPLLEFSESAQKTFLVLSLSLNPLRPKEAKARPCILFQSYSSSYTGWTPQRRRLAMVSVP